MFGSAILEMGIGLIFLFGLFSLLASAIQEVVESYLQRRAKMLRCAIGELLQSLDGVSVDELAGDKAMAALDYAKSDANSDDGASLPSYIPPDVFVDSLIRVASRRDDGMKKLVENTLGVRQSEADLASRADTAELEQELLRVYALMNRKLSEEYRKHTQKMLFLIGFIIAVLVNFDALSVAGRLYQNPSVREIVVAEADFARLETEQPDYFQAIGCGSASDAQARARCARDKTDSLSLPIGWVRHGEEPSLRDIWKGIAEKSGPSWAQSLLGWLLSALAICLGASFWFDLLNKAVNFRSALRPQPT